MATVDLTKEQHYLRMAADHPNILCSAAPVEILEAAASEAEPTKFMEAYFAAGHAGWLAIKHGRTVNLPKDRMGRAIIVLWLRACLLNTDRLLFRESSDANEPFFSDDGLYGGP